MELEYLTKGDEKKKLRNKYYVEKIKGKPMSEALKRAQKKYIQKKKNLIEEKRIEEKEKELGDMIFEIKAIYTNDYNLIHTEIEQAKGLDYVKIKLNRQINRFYNIIIPSDLRTTETAIEQKKQLIKYCEDNNRKFAIDVNLIF